MQKKDTSIPRSKYQPNRNSVYLGFLLISSLIYLVWGFLTPAYFIDGPAVDGFAYRFTGAVIPFLGIFLYMLKEEKAPIQLLFELSFFGYLCSYSYILHQNNYHQIYVLGSFIIQAGANTLIEREKNLIGYNILNLVFALAIFIHPAPEVNPYFFITSVITIALLLCLTTLLKIRAQKHSQALQDRLNQEENQRIIFGRLAHEVNNPLMILLGIHNRMNRIIEKSEDDNETALQLYEYTKNKINPMGSTILRISNLILDLRKSAYGEQLIQMNHINIRELVLTLLEDDALKGQTDHVKITGDTHLYIRFDEASLKKILKEIILNAIHYCKKSVLIDLSTNKVSITNDGSPISSEIVDKIFEPYFTTKKLGEGKGLGLSAARALAAQNSSKIELASNNDSGVCFDIVLNVVD